MTVAPTVPKIPRSGRFPFVRVTLKAGGIPWMAYSEIEVFVAGAFVGLGLLETGVIVSVPSVRVTL